MHLKYAGHLLNGMKNFTDWEAIADREPDELLSSQCLPRVSELSLKNTKVQTPKRRGRGTFSYKKHELYCDQLSSESITSKSEYEDVFQNSKGMTNKTNCKYLFPSLQFMSAFPKSVSNFYIMFVFLYLNMQCLRFF